MKVRRALPLALALALAAPARADEPPAQFEYLFGATDINGALGNGGATAGFSAQGELTLLRWPSPSYFQHVNFRSSPAVDARQQPHFGARDNMGSFAGVYVAPAPNGPGEFAWARDAGWSATQRYLADDSNQLVTTLHNARLRVTITYTDAMAPDADVLVRQIAAAPDAGFVPTALRLVYFENFSPTVEKIEFYPTDQFSLLDDRDYALGYSAAHGALVHFSLPDRPPDKVAALGAARTPADVDAALAALGGASGMFLAVGGDHAPDGFQCGWDLPPAPAGAPVDAYQNALDSAGALGGAPAALTHADGALAWNLPATGGAVDLFIAMGATLDAATGALEAARARGGDALRAADRDFWSAWLLPARLPATDDADRLRLAKRALLSIAVGRDRASGAIVASISSQPPYNLDWPRDGSFIDYALDVAGYHDWVTQHRRFYGGAQRQHDGDLAATGGDTFAGSFAMNYYADGTGGGPIPLEIDEVGFTLWGWYEHAKWLANPRPYLNELYPHIKLAADLLTRCVDAATGLQCAENEDDSFDLTITLHGAAPVRLGLASAVRAALATGHNDDARRWRRRLDGLDAAIERGFGDPALGYVGGVTSLSDVGSIGPVAWTLWPVELHPYSDPRMGLAATQIVSNYTPFFTQMNGGGAYYGKGLVALARYYDGVGDTAGLSTVNDWIDLMIKKVPTSTGLYGESFVYNGNGTYTDVVSIPHLWEATLTYLALMAAYSPAEFARPELATLTVPPAGCSTSASTSASASTSGFLLLLVGIIGRARKRARNWKREGRAEW
jgi:hypothetical protein